MKTRVFLVAFVLFAAAHLAAAQSVTRIVPDGKVHKFEARDRNFWIDGEQTLLVSGEMHFGRVLPEDWETRIKQAKAMGLNTISFYLFWNLCEPEEGKFAFTGMTDVRRVLQLCQQNGMWAILRPGPYCCAEVEYGGIPAWTLRYPNVPIRSTDPKWLEWCKRYIDQVYKQVGDLQVTHGGPLLMVQMDNEFGMISQGNNAYLAELQKIFTGAGFDTQLFTCDPGGPGGQTIEGVLRGPNGYKAGRGGGRGPGRGAAQPEPAVQYPTFVPEVYTNWFNAWGNVITPRYITIEEITQWTAGLIDANASFNYYVFHGGTTYGFFNGCNEYLPLVNSYDYGAPVDEAGRTTQKYWALRDLLSSKLKITPPLPPPEPEVINLPAVLMNQYVPLLDTLPASPTKVDDKPLSMEMLGQSYGFVLYRKKFDNGLKGTLVLKKPMDYAIVMVNGKTVGEAFRGYGQESNTIALPETSGAATLDILVYNLGRISVITAPWTQDRASKGLIDGASLDGQDLNGWEMYSLPMDSTSNLSGWKPRVQFGRGGRGGPGAAPGAGAGSAASAHAGPTLYRGTFDVYKLGGTFLDMRNWSFGVVWVNGHNLGRFWDRGSVRSLFMPSHWLKQGQNEIVVLELRDAPRIAEVSGLASLISEPAVPFASKEGAPIRLDQPAGRGGRGVGGRGRGATTAPAGAPATPNGPAN